VGRVLKSVASANRVFDDETKGGENGEIGKGNDPSTLLRAGRLLLNILPAGEASGFGHLL